MKTYDERTKDILSKLTVAKRRRKTITTAVSLCCCMALLAGILLIPHNKIPENLTISTYSQFPSRGPSDYTPLVKQLSALMEPKDDYLVDGAPFPDLGMPEYNAPTTGAPDVEYEPPTSAPPSDSPQSSPDSGVLAPSEPGDSYEEITDNQVQGVTEADIIKRSNKHIYYLRGDSLTVYSIAGKDSKALGEYEIGSELSDDYDVYFNKTDMYLSQDCKALTILTSCYHMPTQQLYIYLLSLNVSNPENIRVQGSCFLKGNYSTSRLVDEELYLISQLYLDSNVDFDDPGTFLPGYGTPEDMTYLHMDDICIPEKTSRAMYTVVTMLDNSTLEVMDSTAVLSYTGVTYMSGQNIYLTHSFMDETTNENITCESNITEITRVSYSSKGLKNKGSFRVEGRVSNQYWLDEYDGYLRVVTSINNQKWYIDNDPYSDSSYITFWGSTTNASLYCIDLSNHSIRAQVEQFAPEGEDVQSVRFDGNSAYVCTSIVLQDPVFFFDLSDLDNIRYKDTGTIDGYSMSLVDFSDGFLMGIGYGDSFDSLKIEMYREGATTVESHCIYEYEYCWFSSDYKSYYVDRKNQLVGLGVVSYNGGESSYILLRFDGYELVELLDVKLSGDPETMRAVYIDGYLYLFGDDFRVEAL